MTRSEEEVRQWIAALSSPPLRVACLLNPELCAMVDLLGGMMLWFVYEQNDMEIDKVLKGVLRSLSVALPTQGPGVQPERN